MYAPAPLTFPQWLNALDALLLDATGLSLYHLPDLPYASAFERDLSPEDFLDTVIADYFERRAA